MTQKGCRLGIFFGSQPGKLSASQFPGFWSEPLNPLHKEVLGAVSLMGVTELARPDSSGQMLPIQACM